MIGLYKKDETLSCQSLWQTVVIYLCHSCFVTNVHAYVLTREWSSVCWFMGLKGRCSFLGIVTDNQLSFLATQVSQHKISSLRWRCYDDVIILCRDLDPDHILNFKKCQVKWFLSCVYYNEMRYNWFFFSLSVIQINKKISTYFIFHIILSNVMIEIVKFNKHFIFFPKKSLSLWLFRHFMSITCH